MGGGGAHFIACFKGGGCFLFLAVGQNRFLLGILTKAKCCKQKRDQYIIYKKNYICLWVYFLGPFRCVL